MPDKPAAETRLLGAITTPILASASWHTAKTLFQVLRPSPRNPEPSGGVGAAAPSDKTSG